MDLIYTDKNGIDKNIMPTYELDAAFGRDENDFECNDCNRRSLLCATGSDLHERFCFRKKQVDGYWRDY